MLVSCIMPTRGRGYFAAQALECWLRQTYGNTELLILDDAQARSFSIAPTFPNVHYHLAEGRLKIGEKRNHLAALANGGAIAHWDDDDYSAPGRIEDQLDRLLSSGRQLTGYQSLKFRFDDGSEYLFDGGDNYYAGTSLMYRKEFWKQNQFPNLEYGEDTIFISRATNTGQAISAPAGDLMFARSHAGNTLLKVPDGRRWTRIAA